MNPFFHFLYIFVRIWIKICCQIRFVAHLHQRHTGSGRKVEMLKDTEHHRAAAGHAGAQGTAVFQRILDFVQFLMLSQQRKLEDVEIGRASCRERV